MVREDIRSLLLKKKAEQDFLTARYNTVTEQIREQTSRMEQLKKAQIVIQEVAKLTQKELEYHVSELVSLALSAVFDDPYSLELEFQSRRGKAEADLWFKRKDGERVDPLTASGGGAVDVASFALRVSLWSLRTPKTRPVLVLDEPFKHLSAELQPRAGEILKQISERLKIQIIMVTHNPDLIDCADRAFQVSMVEGKSVVKVLEEQPEEMNKKPMRRTRV